MAFAVRTPPVSTTACQRWVTSMNWVVAARNAGHSVIRMFVLVMEYHHPVFFSSAVRFPVSRRDGFTLRTIQRSPPGHLPTPVTGPPDTLTGATSGIFGVVSAC